MTRQYDNYADLITFSRSSSGTALRPISYGDELVTNGDFSSGDLTGWSNTGGSATVTNGEAVVSYNVSNGLLAQYVTVEVGKLYEIKASLTATTSSGPRLKIGTTTNGNDIKQLGGVGDIFERFVATTTTISILAQALTDGSTTIDNISVKEVLFDQPNAPLTLFNHPAGIPRIEYDADGNVLGLLVEEARTNLITYSEDFSNAAWSKTNTATLAIDALAPDNQTSAVTLVDSGATGTGLVGVSESVVVATSTQYTYSVFMKAAGVSQAGLYLTGFTTPANTFTLFDLAAGTVLGVNPAHDAATIESFTDGWYRCSITFTTDAADTSGNVWVILYDGATAVPLDGTSSILIYGAQLEAGAFPTSYIPTSGSTATRAADVASIPVSAFGYNQSEGTVVCEYSLKGFPPNGPTGFPRVWYLDQDTGNYVTLFSNEGKAAALRSDESNTQINSGGALSENTFAKTSATFQSNYIATSTNGANVASSSASWTLDLPTTLSLGNAGGGRILNGHIKSLRYLPRRLTNDQLVEITT